MRYELKGMTVKAIQERCEKISGMCHRYMILGLTEHRLCLQYSNPNEYGSERPIKAWFPVVLYSKDSPENSIVCTSFFSHVTGYDEEWQAFEVIRAEE